MTPYFTPDKQSMDPMESRPSDMTSTSLMPTESDPLGKKGDKKTLSLFGLSGLLQRLLVFFATLQGGWPGTRNVSRPFRPLKHYFVAP